MGIRQTVSLVTIMCLVLHIEWMMVNLLSYIPRGRGITDLLLNDIRGALLVQSICIELTVICTFKENWFWSSYIISLFRMRVWLVLKELGILFERFIFFKLGLQLAGWSAVYFQLPFAWYFKICFWCSMFCLCFYGFCFLSRTLVSDQRRWASHWVWLIIGFKHILHTTSLLI